ncbi:GMC family oxidoreductase N-terminal domain-containing protein [Spongiactinospora sp. TRM90649]|uniref:GMC family oxidoreductase n=1 Tax=Spongiactinospora sp. TRM90649 TaxID=3031114 RepID=UPI0023F94E61|nr:GMC family oxidoreductase N-terminal domain-containing protein [Spongiactinospora sp. TRM90649]MDF5755335.1 GMC family oxidoreductase N-terminal domain-containing protein [Spongiactinospora sp. TRM90649]
MSTEYDYVIVGAGSAGCVLANRLSADPEVSVALVEAGGPDDKLEIRIPAGFKKLFKTPYDWDFTTEKQPELNGRRLYWPRGRMLGGSSGLNAQIWARGVRADYDGWEVPGWAYDDVLPYFQRAEHRIGSNAGGVYGTSGPLHISELRSPNPLTGLFLRACEEIGLARLPELNGPEQDGCSQTPVTQYRGRRWSAADAYLRPARRRANLTVLTGVQAGRVLIADGRAIGVECLDGDVLAARREVILSAGAIGSPHLLMLSGVGDAADLRANGIEPVTDLPEVGRNLQDHLSSGVIVGCTREITLASAESLANLARFLFRRTGMLTSNVGEAVAFVRTSADEPAPDIELVFAPAPFADHGLTDPPGHGMTVGVILLRPESRGRISLSGRDVLIDPCYLTAEADLRRLVAGLGRALEVVDSSALRPYVGPPMTPYWGARTPAELARWVRERAETLYHPVGTCRMGADDASVVDPELRVRGVAGLRVADVSIMPLINRGHTHAPAVMIGERAADLITGAGEWQD